MQAIWYPPRWKWSARGRTDGAEQTGPHRSSLTAKHASLKSDVKQQPCTKWVGDKEWDTRAHGNITYKPKAVITNWRTAIRPWFVTDCGSLSDSSISILSRSVVCLLYLPTRLSVLRTVLFFSIEIQYTYDGHATSLMVICSGDMLLWIVYHAHILKYIYMRLLYIQWLIYEG